MNSVDYPGDCPFWQCPFWQCPLRPIWIQKYSPEIYLAVRESFGLINSFENWRRNYNKIPLGFFCYSPDFSILILLTYDMPYIAWLPWNLFFRSKSTKIMNFRKLKECFVQFSSAVQWRPFLGSKGDLGSF